MKKSALRWFGWLRAPLFWWVKTKVVPALPEDELGIDPTKPVCYILPTRSLSDVMIFERTCREKRLPLPHMRPSGLNGQGAAYIYLHKLGLLQTQRGDKEPPTPLAKLVSRAISDPDLEVQVVPVSIFWGRRPGRTERSLFKLLFFDEERSGILQKFFIVLAQGRNVLVNFGKPISLRELVSEGPDAEQVAKKLRRVLKVHFRRQRTATMGPTISDRSQVIAHVVSGKLVRRAIQEEAAKRRIPPGRVEKKARHYIDEIAANPKSSVIRFLEIILHKMWNRIYRGIEVVHTDRLRALAKDYEIVYLPCHRSHMDYLLLGYVLYVEGLSTPHTGAGINLNFWPVGPLLRRGGAFYLRRSFGGNRLYTAVFNEYLGYLLTKGHSLSFFVEGGRSRTGKLLQPKTGLLSMVVQAFLRGAEKPVCFVPTYIGYEKVVEIKSYMQEMRGWSKRQESVRGLIKARQVLKTNFGRVYVNFGAPIFLEEHLNQHAPNWKESFPSQEKPSWLTPVVNSLARDALTRVNDGAAVSPSGLCALILLSSPSRALAEAEFVFTIDKFLRAIRLSPYARNTFVQEGDGTFYLRAAEDLGSIKRFKHPAGDVLFLEEAEGAMLSYYRNNIIHLVAVPSLVASFFQHNDSVQEGDLVESCVQMYPFLRGEYFLRWSDAEIRGVLEHIVALLVDLQLLRRDAGGELTRPPMAAPEFNGLKILGRTLGPTLERYTISAALLAGYAASAGVKREDFEKQCQLMAQRVSILNGMNDPEFYDKAVFRNFVELMRTLGFLKIDDDGNLVVGEQVRTISKQTLGLLSMDLRESIQRAASPDAIITVQEKLETLAR